MNALLNIIWILFCGIGLAIGWIFSGVIMIITIIGIPFSGACFELAGQSLMPFGKVVVERKHLDSEVKPRPVLSAIWIIFCGIWMFLAYIYSGIIMMITIVGIPLGLQCFKMSQIAFNPYKYTLVDKNLLNKMNNNK